MNLEDTTLHAELEERLRFETLLADLSSKFINLPAGEVDREIEDAQRRVCECLGFELCTLWQWTQDIPRYITITHLYRPLGGPPPPERIDGEDMAPWCLRQLEAGKIVPVASMESLPPEAARDKEVWRHYGVKSALSFPLSAGSQLFGALTFNTVREERAWPTEMVTRLTVVAQVFANALVRKVTDQALRQSMAENERLRERLQAESDYLKAEIKVTQAHGEVIGRSRAIVFCAHWETESALHEHICSDFYPRLLVACELSNRPPEICFHHVSATQGMDLIEQLRGRGGECLPATPEAPAR